MVKPNLTGAKYGLNSWLQQRVTAVIMLVVAVVFIAVIAFMALDVDANISSWQGLFHHLWVQFFMQVFFAAMLLHAWVGVRDILMDYVKCTVIKLTLYVLTILWLIGSLVYSIKIIWM